MPADPSILCDGGSHAIDIWMAPGPVKGGLNLMEPDTTPIAAPVGDLESSVGRVQGLLDSTPLLWHVAVQDGAYLQLDDVVVTVRDVPGRAAWSRPPGSSPKSAPGTRAPVSAATSSSYRMVSCRPRSRRSPRSPRPGSSRSSTSRRGPAAGRYMNMRSSPGTGTGITPNRRKRSAKNCTSRVRSPAVSPRGCG